MDKMGAGVEFGRCDVCGKEGVLRRTYWQYDIECECHSPNHFEMVRHCVDCIPIEPEYTNITIKTSHLNRLYI